MKTSHAKATSIQYQKKGRLSILVLEGKRIRIVKPLRAFGAYRKGDVLTVKSRFGDSHVQAEGIKKLIEHSEYVLEDTSND